MKFINQYDKFGQAVPGFNLKGETMISTSVGSALTLISAVIVLIYAISKTTHLQSVTGQTISMYFESQDTSKENLLNLNEREFRIAFSFENFATKQLMGDPRYVRWIIRMMGTKDDIDFEHILPYHKCTDDDYAQFYPINPGFESELKEIRGDPARGFYCIDWSDEEPYRIFGDVETSSDVEVLEAILAPCNYVHKEIDIQNGLQISD